MTEKDWRESSFPFPMLHYLRGRASDRKLRLFAAVCCRRVVPLLRDPRSHAALAVAERFAEGRATQRERADAQAHALAAYRLAGRAVGAAKAASVVASRSASGAAEGVAWAAARLLAAGDGLPYPDERAEWRVQADLLREIVGNPFRPVAVEPRWLAWNDATVPKLAQQVYDGRRWQDFPVLADALEDAGCDDEQVLGHCRRLGGHVRGCWVLDLLLGKE
jgi:hypothetical protein